MKKKNYETGVLIITVSFKEKAWHVLVMLVNKKMKVGQGRKQKASNHYYRKKLIKILTGKSRIKYNSLEKY